MHMKELGSSIKSCLLLLLFLLLLAFGFKVALAASNLEEGVSQLANQISKSMQEKQKQKIAIIDFSDLNGNVTALGQFMAEELTTQLFIIAPGKFEVVERRQIMKLEEELVLGQVGIIEEKGIKKMGQVLGVDAIVTGSMTDLGNTIKINARLIGVESAKIFAVAATDIPKTGMVADLIAKKVLVTERKIDSRSNDRTESTENANVGPKIYEDDYLRVTIKTLSRMSRTATMELWYENLSDEVIKFRSVNWGTSYSTDHRGTYLVSEKGLKWKYVQDSEIGNHYGGIELLPKQKLLNKITFSSVENDDSKLFTYTGDYSITATNRANNRAVKVTIQNVKVE